MKKLSLLIILVTSIVLYSGIAESQIKGDLRFFTNYGQEAFDMGLTPVQDRAELQARVNVTHVPYTFGAVGIEYLGSVLYYNAYLEDVTDSYSQSMLLYWDKTWGGMFGKLYTKLGWMFQTYYEQEMNSGQFVEGTLGLVVPSNPYLYIRREYSEYEFNEFRLGLKQFFSLSNTNDTRIFLSGSLNYIGFDESYLSTVNVNVSQQGDQVVVVDRQVQEAYSNWHSYRAMVGFSWRFRSGMELFPTLEVVGGLNKEARDEMLRLGNTDLLWIPTINFFYTW